MKFNKKSISIIIITVVVLLVAAVVTYAVLNRGSGPSQDANTDSNGQRKSSNKDQSKPSGKDLQKQAESEMNSDYPDMKKVVDLLKKASKAYKQSGDKAKSQETQESADSIQYDLEKATSEEPTTQPEDSGGSGKVQ